MENEFWRWLWTGAALFLGLAEVFTAGFFLLPFAIGAAGAAVLGWLDVFILWQWLAFFVLTLVSFWILRRYIHRQNREEQPPVGAKRHLGARGVVMKEVSEFVGMVRLGGEEWRASTTGHPIPVDTPVTVVAVEGTRLMVEPVAAESQTEGSQATEGD